MTRLAVEVQLWNFFRDEFREVDRMAPGLLIRLQLIRDMVRLPIHVTSSFRAGDPGAHGRGLALDLSDNLRGEPISSTWRHRVLRAAYSLGFERIGDYDRHIHVDLDPSLPQEVTWWKPSS